MNTDRKILDSMAESVNAVENRWNNILKSSKDTAREKSGVTDLVTVADTTVEDIIVDKLSTNHPGAGILAEERERIDGSEGTFIIDPIDGTWNFSKGIPLYCISIAYEKNDEIQAGYVYFPSLELRVSSIRGSGVEFDGLPLDAMLDDNHGVSDVASFEGSTISATPIGEGNHVANKIQKEVVEQNGRYFRVQCVIYMMVEAAKGSIEGGIVYNAKPWDVAAGYLFVEESGGVVTDHTGSRDWRDIRNGSYIYSNGFIHEKLINFID